MVKQEPILKKLATLKNLPTLPHILLKLIEACNQDSGNSKELSRIIEKDPSLSIKILRMVNSAYYGLPHKVASIRQAVTILGTNAIRNIAVCTSVHEVFNHRKESADFNLKLFWWHSLKCAVLSNLIAKKITYSHPDEAFLSGLLHDIGRMVLWINSPERYAALWKACKDKPNLLLDGEIRLIATHCEIGAWLLHQWKLPTSIADAISCHHESKSKILKAPLLVQIVYVANALCQEFNGRAEEAFKTAVDVFGFEAVDIEAILSQADEETKQVAQTLDIEIEQPKESPRYFSENDLKKHDALVDEVKHFSLLFGTLQDFLEAGDHDEILRTVHQGLELLFDVKNVIFFLRDPEKDCLIGKTVTGNKNHSVIQGLPIPMQMKTSLLVTSLLHGKPQDSFCRSTVQVPGILDEQIIRALGDEGMVCFPMLSGAVRVGVIAIGLDQVKFNHLSRQFKLLRLFSNQAAMIIERNQITEALRESRQKMRAILRASPVGIGLVANGRIEWGNEAMYRLVGYEKSILLEKSARLLYRDDDEYDRVSRKLHSDIAHSEAGLVETQWVRKDRTIFDCMVCSCPLDPTDPSMGHILVVNDISESKRLEAQLQRAQKMEAIGTLAGGVAHDLNNILSGLVSYPELLLLQIPENSPLRKPMLTIQKSGEKAAAIVQDLLTLARRGVVVTEVVNLNDVISEYLESPEHKKLQSYHIGVHMEVHLDKDALNLFGSSTHLSKTVMNLISNAAEAMPEGGKIAISTENRYLDKPIRGYDDIKEGDYVVLTISDTGTGISPDEIEKIFEPFYTKKKMGRSGTGLGMAVVWGTVKDHNGYIDVQSTEGEGTTFALYFPVTREKLSEEKSALTLQPYRGNGESILIVDDVEEQRLIASGMLTQLGYSVVSSSSGEEAVEYLKTNKVDLLLLDMIMDPGMDGLDTYKKIIELHPGQKAIIASGFSETDRARELQNLGAGAYIAKPFLLEKIGLAIKEELEKQGSFDVQNLTLQETKS